MKKRFELIFDVTIENGRVQRIVIDSNSVCPNCMSNRELSYFVQCLTVVNNLCIDEVKERSLYVKKKHEKRTR